MATPVLRSNDRILRKALELFSERGYDATSVREICEAAGITKPTLYHFHGSKEGVYRAIVEGALERFRERHDARRCPATDRSAITSRRRRAPTWTARCAHPDLSRFLMALIHNPPRSAPATDFVGFYQGVLAEVGRSVDAAARAARLLQGPTEMRLLVFMGALGEAMCGNLLSGRPELTHELADRLVDVVLRGWTGPAAS